MQYKLIGLVLCVLLSVAGCVTDSEITQEEMKVQNIADEKVSGILFEKGLESSASYNIRKDGYVVILFDDNVSDKEYTEVVNLLRSSTDIKGVRAEQYGVEVCALPY